MGSSPTFLIPASLGFQCLLSLEGEVERPCLAMLCYPSAWALLGVGEGVRTGLSVSNGCSWAGYRQNWTQARASRVFGREATTTPSSTGTSTVCSRSERVSLAVLETCPSVQEPL